jgi:MYXO-CTERM domain-containing protein
MPMRLLPLMIGAALVAAPAAAQDNNAAMSNTTGVMPTSVSNEAAVDTNVEAPPPATDTAVPAEPAAPAPAKKSFPWGVLGLLGLVGLFGKRRRS